MRYAIIAAGEGSRLTQEGMGVPKPLVKIQGECLLDRLIRIFMDNDAEEIDVICNDMTTLVSDHLKVIQEQGLDGCEVPLRYIVKRTPSSMHSFFELSRLMDGAPFVLTTVDTIFREYEFKDFIHTFQQTVEQGFDGLMGITDFVDDEKPLYVEIDRELDIWAFLDDSDGRTGFVSGGIYALTAPCLDTLRGCVERGESRMRNYQRALLKDGRRLRGYVFSQVMDIDHVSDVEKAELFLGNAQKEV